jgi:hypothetical protein
MTIKGSGRSAWILAAGLLVCFAAPSQAATDTTAASSKAESADGTSVASRHVAHPRKYAHHRSGKVALKPSDDAKAAPTEQAADDGAKLSTMPAAVANANAALPDTDTPAGNAAAMTARASDNLQADAPPTTDTQVVAADQLNDVDRALHEGNSPAAPAMALASAEPPAAPAAPVMANSNESSTWDQTSLIGKIFIGFGALLTMASAARMFMA